MQPAFSVLFLTTLIGVGQGMLVALVAGQWYYVIGSGEAWESDAFYAKGAAIALVFLAAGLLASFFHLANPQRAWRTATRWRTSWLSREVVVLPAVMGLAVIWAGVHWFEVKPVLLTFSNEKSLDLTMAVGFLAAGASIVLYVVTAMIYACVRFIREWASGWTVTNFMLMGLASGFTAAAAYAALSGSRLTDFLVAGAIGLTALAGVARAAHLWRNLHLAPPSTLRAAIGVRFEPIRQITPGFGGPSFNTTEFSVHGGAGSIRGLTWDFFLLAFLLPVLLLAAGGLSGEGPFTVFAFVLQLLGLIVERWVFFAQGRHVQNLYYQAQG